MQAIGKAALKATAVQHIPHKSLHVSKPTWWLESRFHFSFADYWDEKRLNFGPLRVVNDDLVKPRAGFGTHPHRDAEIFSYVVDGYLTHKDNMGNKESLPRGCVQYLSAGTGITHSEMNDHDETVRFLQIWFTPDKRGHTPQYGSSKYEKADRHNRLLRVLGGSGEGPAWPEVNAANDIHLHQDAYIFVSESDAGRQYDLPLGPGRQAYVVCIEGSMDVNGTQLQVRDALEARGEKDEATLLTVRANEPGAHFMLMEMTSA